MSTLVGSMQASASGLATERTRMNVISTNVANANAVGGSFQDVYARRETLIAGDENGSAVLAIRESRQGIRAEMDPDNPLADAAGYVYRTNVNPVLEMVDMMSASRAYEVNVAAFNSATRMVRAALSIGRQ